MLEIVKEIAAYGILTTVILASIMYSHDAMKKRG